MAQEKQSKESRISMLRQIASKYDRGEISSPNGHFVAEQLREVADRLTARLSEKAG